MRLIGLRNLAAAIILAVTAQPALAQDPSRYDLLHSSYALWGMMDAMANFCWEASGFEIAAFGEAHQAWLARNAFARDELDAVREAFAEDPSVAAAGEQAGASGVRDMMAQATNAADACVNWHTAATTGNQFEAETFLSYQLGILRERDGL